uniref:Glypican 2 n=1 Tax=Fundulus heteroclitus TaxID=8078 RepID=A0A3Q2QBY2_FUNHE
MREPTQFFLFKYSNAMQISGNNKNVFQGCGNPRPAPARNKRSPSESGGNRRPFRTYTPEEKPTTAAGTNLDRLVTELKERLRPMRGFWVSLPHTICNDERMAADVTNEDRCWNGQTRGRYLPDVTGNGLASQINNPEVEVDVARPDVRTKQLIVDLRVMTNKLKHAEHGQDMNFIDSEFTFQTALQKCSTFVVTLENKTSVYFTGIMCEVTNKKWKSNARSASLRPIPPISFSYWCIYCWKLD